MILVTLGDFRKCEQTISTFHHSLNSLYSKEVAVFKIIFVINTGRLLTATTGRDKSFFKIVLKFHTFSITFQKLNNFLFSVIQKTLIVFYEVTN